MRNAPRRGRPGADRALERRSLNRRFSQRRRATRLFAAAGLAWAALCGGAPVSGAEREIPIEVRRLSERVIVLTDPTLGGNNVTAIASTKGLVVVDTSGAPAIAARMRGEIEKAFGRKDFAYVVNTHEDFDHIGGNEVFRDCAIVGHERCLEAMRGFRANQARVTEDRIAWQRRLVDETAKRLADLAPESPEADAARKTIERSEGMIEFMSRGVDFTPPTVTFSDRMSLDLGDLTVRVFFFGSAHSRSDVLVQVPEEGLLITGDLFSPGVPGFDVGEAQKLDVPRCLEVLDTVLGPAGRSLQVVCGHRDIWPRAELEARRDYARSVWEGVVKAKSEGLSLKETLTRLPLTGFLPDVKDGGVGEANFATHHEAMVGVFRRQLQQSAASVVERALRESGVEGARKAFHEGRIDPAESIHVDENELNELGYRLLQEGRLDDGIAVFTMNTEAFPESWNVWDSLGEAYTTRGEIVRAVEHYTRSVALNPDNRNGIAVLEGLRKEEQATKTGKFLDLGATRLYYEEAGKGPAVVLIHGGLVDHRMWDGQFKLLSKNYRVIRYDTRGHGLTRNAPGAYADHEDLYRMLSHLGIRNAAVIGLSMGGRIAIDFALEHPDMVSALIPVGAGLSGFEIVDPLLEINEKALGAALGRGDYEEAVEHFQRAWTDGPKRSPEAVDAAVRTKVRSMVLENIRPKGTRGRLTAPDPPAVTRLAAIRAPTLIIVGDLDMAPIYAIADRLAADIPGARKVVIPGAAHMVNMEQPKAFNETVIRFLDGEIGRRSSR